MPDRRKLSAPHHNLLHLSFAAMGASMLAIALIDWIDHFTTLRLVMP